MGNTGKMFLGLRVWSFVESAIVGLTSIGIVSDSTLEKFLSDGEEHVWAFLSE